MFIFSLFPLLSLLIFSLAYKGNLKNGISLSFGFLLLSLVLGQITGMQNAGKLYAIIFFAAGLFPILLRKKVLQETKIYRNHRTFLRKAISKKGLDCKERSKIHEQLLDEMHRISKRYSFTKNLVSSMEEETILSALAFVFSPGKKELGLAFSKMEPSHPPTAPTILPIESVNNDQKNHYNPVFTKGWLNKDEWKSILESASFPLEPINSGPISSQFQFPESLKNRGWIEEGDSLALIGAPVKWSEKTQGLLTFLFHGSIPRDFLGEVSVYAQLFGLGLHKTTLYQKVLEQSRKDGLTHLYLRRTFLKRVNEEINFTKRYGTSFSVLMLDIDHFKLINDTYGHTAGDTVLKNLAHCLKSTLHPGVTISRYGGEEFAILIGLTPSQEVKEIAEKVRTAVASMKIQLTDLDLQDHLIKITVSIGVTHYFPDRPELEEMILRADQSLYRAKASGRNCVREWQPLEKRDGETKR